MGFSVSLLLSVVTLMLSSPVVAQPDGESCHFLRAQAAYRNDQPDSAAHHARQALVALEQQQRWNQHAYVQGWLGDLYRREERSDSAFFYLSRALVSVTSNPVRDTTRAQVYHYLGDYYKSMRQPAQAIQMFQQAAMIQQSLDDRLPLAKSYSALGYVYRYTYFDYITAQQYYQQALQLLEEVEGQDQDTKELFSVLYSLATTSRLKKDYEQALAYGYRAAALAETFSSSYQEVCYTMLGNILNDQGNNAAAIYNFQRALALGIDRLGNDDPALIIRLNNLATVYIESDSLQKGVWLLEQAVQINQTSGGQGKDDIADTYELRGNAYVKEGKTDSASVAYHQSLRLNQKVYGPQHPLTTDILTTLGKFHTEQTDYDSALYYFQRALAAAAPEFQPDNTLQNPAVRTLMNDPLKFQLLYHKAVAMLAQHQSTSDSARLVAALDCFARADSLMDSCRVLYDQETAKLSFLEDHRDVYERAVGCAYQLYQSTSEERYLAWAFHFMEKSKAVVLWEALVDSQIKNSVGIPDSLLEQERAIRVELAYLNNALQAAETSGSDSVVTELRTQQFTLARRQEALTRHLQQTYPNYFRIKYGQDQYTLAQARRHTASANTTLVEYLWGKDQVYALSINPQRTILAQFALTDSLRQALATVLRTLQQPPQMVQRTEEFQQYTQAAHTLYDQWLRPLLPPATKGRSGWFATLQEAQRQLHPPALTIVADGPLAYLPFEALLTRLPVPDQPNYRRLPYLIDTLSVSYAPSAQVLTQRPNHVRNAMRFLAFGYTNAEQDTARSRWQSLPGTVQEIAALGRMAEGTFYTGLGATEHQFKSEAEHYDVIHLAVHGLADTLHPNNSRLLFRTEHDSIEDGYLYSYELYDLQLRADLAVLSACESGTGRLQRGEGVYSLARGFTYAGCPTVVMSLWKVDDAQTSVLMPTFYRELYTGSPVDQALRTAKLKFREHCSSFYAHPAFWSAFVVGGTTAPVMSYQATHHVTAVVLLLSAIYFGLAFWSRRAKPTNQLHHYNGVGH